MPRYNSKIPQPRFRLKSGKEKQRLIIMFFVYRGNNLVYSTGEKVHLNHWDKAKQKAKQIRGFYEQNEMINERLKELSSKTIQIYTNSNYGNLTIEEFKKKLNSKVESGRGLIELIKSFDASGKNMSGGKLRGSTHYRDAYVNLKGYMIWSNKQIDFSDIDMKFRDSFLDFSYEKNNSQNYARKILMTIKQFVTYARETGLTNHEVPKIFLPSLVETSAAPRLTSDEVSKFEKVVLSKSLEKYRDVFLIGCYTGLRNQDWKKVDSESIKSGTIKIMTNKMFKEVEIPLDDKVIELLKKYDYQLPKVSYQAFAREIKQIAKAAIPESKFNRVWNEAGMMKTDLVSKWEFISSHSARKTFATNNYLAGWSKEAIQMILGHKDSKTTDNYIDADASELMARDRAMIEFMKNFKK